MAFLIGFQLKKAEISVKIQLGITYNNGRTGLNTLVYKYEKKLPYTS